MPQQVREFTVTVPPGTLPTQPYVQDVSFPSMAVQSITWRMPHGHAGLVGWALTSAGANVIPTVQGQWIVGDGNSGNYATDKYPDSGSWQVTAYNLGNYPHTIYVTFHLNVVVKRQPRTRAIPEHLLTSAHDLSRAGRPIGRQQWPS